MVLLVMMCSSNLLQIKVKKWSVVCRTVLIAFLQDGCYQGFFFPVFCYLVRRQGFAEDLLKGWCYHWAELLVDHRRNTIRPSGLVWL